MCSKANHVLLNHGRPGRACRRAAFTLVEMLVVLLIISLIAALGIGAYLTLPDYARQQGTEALIVKIDARLSQMVDEFNQRREAISVLPADLALSAAHPNRARVIALTRNLRQEFPEKFDIDTSRTGGSADNDGDGQANEADEIIAGEWNPVDVDQDGTPDQAGISLPAAAIAHLKYVERVFADPQGERQGVLFKDAHVAATARAECLYMIVTKGGTDTSDFSEDEIADTDNDGLPEFVDKWGVPLQFFLWPTHYASPLQRPGAEKNSYDPQQLLTEDTAASGGSPWWDAAGGGRQFARLYHSLSKASTAATAPPVPPLFQNTACGYNTRYLIVSAGVDAGFGFVTAGAGDDGIMGTMDDIAIVDKRVIVISDPSVEGYGMDGDNIDNHRLRAR